MRQPAGTPARRNAKAPGSTRQPVAKTARQTLHLDETTVQRLGVHCSLVGRDRSAVANEVLAGWLARFGRGRQLWDSADPVDTEDRPGDGSPVNDSEGSEAA